MAKMTITPAVTKTKVVEVSPTTYTLELNEKEYKVLVGLVGAVGGDLGEIRKVIEELWRNAKMADYFRNNGLVSLFKYVEPIDKDFPK